VSRSATVGLAQLTAELYAPEQNRAMASQALGELFRRGADLVVLPELMSSGYGTDRGRLEAVAEPVDGHTVETWCAAAARGGGLVAGGLCERDGDRIFNTAVLVNGDGVLLHYRKLHLFAGEKLIFTPGDLGLPVAETPLGVIGLCVCYDLRFVETVRALALQGADLVAVPTAWLPGFDRERWDSAGYAPQARGVLLQANLDQVYIACASQAGSNRESDFLGSSLLCDPYGKTIEGPLSRSRPELATATIDLDAVARAQEREALIKPREDRRTDVYGLVVGGQVL
jgi:N-carbamoylputrescine amidase